MKNNPKTAALIIGIIMVLFIQCQRDKSPLSPSPGNIHIRKGFVNYNGSYREYKFNNVPADIGFIQIFPADVIEGLPDSIMQYIEFEYRIYTSIEDAELAMVEHLDLRNEYLRNIIDYPLPEGMIGHNCWHQIEMEWGTITFIRNNVLISIYENGNIPIINVDLIELVARSIDTALINTNKVSNSDLVPAPSIHAVDIISDYPDNWGQVVTLKITATDPNSQKLWYRKYATGFACVSDTGRLTTVFDESIDASGEPMTAKIKIWVWNEDYIVNSVEKIFPLGL